jgi:hypothetical protein
MTGSPELVIHGKQSEINANGINANQRLMQIRDL